MAKNRKDPELYKISAKNWIDPNEFARSKGVAKSDSPTKRVATPKIAGYEKPTASLSPYNAGLKLSPAQQVELEKNLRNRKMLENVQAGLGAAEVLGAFPHPITEGLGFGAGLLNAGLSSYLAGEDYSAGNYGGMAGNLLGAGLSGAGAAVLAPKKVTDVVNTAAKSKNLKELGAYALAGVPPEKAVSRIGKGDLKAMRQVQEVQRKTPAEYEKYLQAALDEDIPDIHFEKAFGKTKSEAQDLIKDRAVQRAAYEQQVAQRQAQEAQRLEDLRAANAGNVQTQAVEDIDVNDIDWSQFDESNDSMSNYDYGAERFGHDLDIDNAANQLAPPPDTIYTDTSSRPFNFDIAPYRAPEGYVEDAAGVFRNQHGETVAEESARLDQQYAEYFRSNYLADEQGYGSPSVASQLAGGQFRDAKNQLGEVVQEVAGNPNAAMREVKEAVTNSTGENKLKNKALEMLQDYPYYGGDNVHFTNPSEFLSNIGSKKGFAERVNRGVSSAEQIPSGQVFTGSTNTSHNSYLPQLKKIFKEGVQEGDPTFLGYKRMNDSGYLSKGSYSPEEIAAYLNTEIDEQIRRNIVPKNIQRPYVKDNEILLPQYGITKKKNGGILDKGGELDKYASNVAASDATRTKFTKNTGIKKGPDQPIGNMLDITLNAPQRQLVKMITGKEQSPSEAMGIKNPYGAFATDAILDPANLVGAGLAKKAIGSFAKKKAVGEAASKIDLNNLYKNIPIDLDKYSDFDFKLLNDYQVSSSPFISFPDYAQLIENVITKQKGSEFPLIRHFDNDYIIPSDVTNGNGLNLDRGWNKKDDYNVKDLLDKHGEMTPNRPLSFSAYEGLPEFGKNRMLLNKPAEQSYLKTSGHKNNNFFDWEREVVLPSKVNYKVNKVLDNFYGGKDYHVNITNPYMLGLPVAAGAAVTMANQEQKNGGWLNKYEDGGELNYNDYSVSASEGFEGDGYSNVGRNYSPAWGGQFAMGGSLPGSVGFMYARTNDPAPSEGPYAKKTLPSAQDGIVAKTDATRVAAPALKLTKAQLDKNKAINKQVMANTEKANAKKLAERNNAMTESSDAGVINPNGKRFAIGDKLRLFPSGKLYSGDTNNYGEAIDDYFNPAVFTGNVASGLGNAMIDRDPAALAIETGMALGAGALGFDPLGDILNTKLKFKAPANLNLARSSMNPLEGIKNAYQNTRANMFRANNSLDIQDTMHDYQHIADMRARRQALVDRIGAQQTPTAAPSVPPATPTENIFKQKGLNFLQNPIDPSTGNIVNESFIHPTDQYVKMVGNSGSGEMNLNIFDNPANLPAGQQMGSLRAEIRHPGTPGYPSSWPQDMPAFTDFNFFNEGPSAAKQLQILMQGIDGKPVYLPSHGNVSIHSSPLMTTNLARYIGQKNAEGIARARVMPTLDYAGRNQMTSLNRILKGGNSAEQFTSEKAVKQIKEQFPKIQRSIENLNNADPRLNLPQAQMMYKNQPIDLSHFDQNGFQDAMDYRNNFQMLHPQYSAIKRWREGGELTKLDQLTNFTNYNTKQPGGWLDKYQ